ncbi:PadR family transcriptional regulator [Azospirillum picis]|uniref:DNA-binding PadR family transcriptional regulator n=1 Tax=Azospirillum picis TaxID=488438 RepID=A0ABU0MPB4_9PROT|nr:PadR family transcriptional regulator [Azospirillum picis]MBP2301480.1 DNA-binding PadR family transcriptional regulator [Azospirillum picis]MDQ0535312.1 DNA-binding PadR family transcriptional regulator [Azospirillum picis]
MFRHLFHDRIRRFSRPDFDDEAPDQGPGRHGGHGGHGGGRHGHRGGWDQWAGRGGRGGQGGRGRIFDHGDLRLVLLWLIADKPRSGYDLIKSIEDLVGGAYSPSPGVVYPTLTLLEEQGHIRMASADGNKKTYEITPDGVEALKAAEPTVAAIRERIAHARAHRQRESAPQIVRAIENFKLALRLRLSRGDLTPEQTQAIADAIDDAARAVERS